MKDIFFYGAVFGFGAGVFWRSFFDIGADAAFALAFVSASLVFFFSLVSRRNWAIFISVFALACSMGILRLNAADKSAPEVFERRVGEKSTFSGTIVDNPAQRETGVELVVGAEEGEDETKILVSAKTGEDYQYGDRIRVIGILEKPKNFLTDQGKEFDYVNYLRKDGIFYTMRNPKIDVVSREGGAFIKRALFYAKKKFDAALDASIPAPESAVMGALILGERSSLSQALRQAFVNTGTIHVVTISGYHVALIAGWVMWMFGFLPINFAAAAGICAVFLYVVVTGGAQSAIRSGIMAVLAMLARITGRTYDAARALLAAGAVMILINPFILAFDISFQLSFLAVIAVIFLSPRIEKYFYWITGKWLRDMVAITCSAYMFVLPFILYKIGTLSFVAFPANLAVLPFIPATMIAGFITGCAGLLSSTLALIPGKVAYLGLHYELAAVGFFSRLPFAALSIPNFPFWLAVLVYAIFLYALFGEKPTQEVRSVPRAPRFPGILNVRFFLLITPLVLTFMVAGLLYYPRYRSNQIAKRELETLLTDVPAPESSRLFEAHARTKSAGCVAAGGLPDRACTPGAVFPDATVERICVAGYTKSVRNVSTNLRKRVYAEYGVAYPQPRGAYEVDHLVPLALAGSNDIANLWTEEAQPAPGFHEKDLVEIYLQGEVCSGRVALPIAQRQIVANWLAVYNALSLDELAALKRKYGGD